MGKRNSKGHDLLQGDTIATQQKILLRNLKTFLRKGYSFFNKQGPFNSPKGYSDYNPMGWHNGLIDWNSWSRERYCPWVSCN